MISSSARAQFNQGASSTGNLPSSVHGTVLNRITREPIAAPCLFPDQRYAMLTDDRGHFEFKFPPQEPEPEGDLSTIRDAGPIGARQLRVLQNLRPNVFLARSRGICRARVIRLWPRQRFATGDHYLSRSGVSDYRPRHLPGTEGDLRVRLELYRRDVNEGQEHWTSAAHSRRGPMESFVSATWKRELTNWCRTSNSIGIHLISLWRTAVRLFAHFLSECFGFLRGTSHSTCYWRDIPGQPDSDPARIFIRSKFPLAMQPLDSR